MSWPPGQLKEQIERKTFSASWSQSDFLTLRKAKQGEQHISMMDCNRRRRRHQCDPIQRENAELLILAAPNHATTHKLLHTSTGIKRRFHQKPQANHRANKQTPIAILY